MRRRLTIFVATVGILSFTATAKADGEVVKDESQDNTLPSVVRQPSFVSDAGILNKNEHAFIFSANGDVLPPALMLGYRYGITNWWEVGFDAGGDRGVFQALLHTKFENYSTVNTETFYWGTRLNTGYKYHRADLSKNLYFDDNSWILEVTNTLALRFGAEKKRAFYLNTGVYFDWDLRGQGRQTDYYFRPASLGFETVAGKYGNFFVDAGAVWSINGMETDRGVLYKNSWFPVIRLGFALRTDDKTAVHGTAETRDKARRQ